MLVTSGYHDAHFHVSNMSNCLGNIALVIFSSVLTMIMAGMHGNIFNSLNITFYPESGLDLDV